MSNGFSIPKLQIPPPPQVPMPDGVPAPMQELGHTGQKTLNQVHRSLNGILQGGNPIVEMISGVQSAMQNIPLPTEFVADVRRGMRNARFPFAELGKLQPGAMPPLPPFPGMNSGNAEAGLQIEPGTPTGQREKAEQIPVF